MRFYFVRHGESEANLLNEFSNRGARHPLTERGRAQVSALAEKLRGVHFLAIYSSPILRAIQSAEILAANLHVPYRVTEALREYDVGILEGKADPESWKKYYELLGEWLVKGNWDARIEGGESLNDMRYRFVPLIETLQKAHSNQEGAVLLVSHGGLYRCVLPLVLSNIDFEFSLAHTLGHTEFVLAEPGRNVEADAFGPQRLTIDWTTS